MQKEFYQIVTEPRTALDLDGAAIEICWKIKPTRGIKK